jgi:hypothetical protein
MGSCLFEALSDGLAIIRVIVRRMRNAPIERTCAKRNGEMWSKTTVEITPLKEKTNAPITR